MRRTVLLATTLATLPALAAPTRADMVDDCNQSRDPDFASAYLNRGVSHKVLGEYERAVRDWEQAIRIDAASWAKWWRKYMKRRGHHSGAIDGIFGPATRRALLACAYDPAC